MSSLKVSYNITTAQNSIRIHNQEGYVTKLRRSGSLYAGLRLDPVYTTYYYRRDHLGNNVAVWNATKDSTEQRMFYYASGLPMSCSTSQSLQSRKYNGKEYVEDHGYDVYDYGFRGYYATIGRFTITNPLAEQTPWQSPYAYASNNSINNVDLWGLGAITISSSFQTSHINVQTCNWAAVDSNGNVLGWGDDEDDFHVYLVNELWDGTYVGLNGFRKIGWEIRTNDFSGYEIGSPCYYLRSVTHGDWKNGAFVAVGSMQLMYGNQVIAPSKMIDNTLDAALHYYIGFGRPAALGNHETYMAFWKKLLPHDELNSIGSFFVNMTNDIFHIGRTTVAYQKGSTYDIFICGINDGFWDPNYLFEIYLGIQTDKTGRKLELGGIPYDYVPLIILRKVQ